MNKTSYEPPQDTPLGHLGRAVKLVGGQSAMARACGIKQGHVWAWLNKTSKCPAEHVLSIEQATGGTVTRHQLRPDLYPDSISRAESPPMPPKPPTPAKTSSRKKTPRKSGGGKGKLKIAIYGAGAIGGYLGVQLALAGNDVSLIARGPHLKAMKKNGLKLLIDGEERVAKNCLFTDDPAEAGPQDYVFITLKSHQAYDAAGRFKPLLGPDTAVVTAMNGVPWWYFFKLKGKFENHRLENVDPGGWQWKTIGPERAIGCVVYPATEIIEPGVIKHVYGNKFTLGEPDGVLTERCQRLSDAMTGAGFKAPVRDNIRDDIWIKLWGNLCFNPISALTGATLDVVATDPSTRILSRCMMLEAQDIGEALGVHFRVDVHRRINGAAEVGPHKTSMLQDLENGKPMEIDALVTAVQEMGRLVDIETPYIDSVLGLIQQRGKVLGLYPTFTGPDLASDAMAGEDTRELVD